MLITISRQAATNGDLIAQLVGEQLNLQVYDGEVVDEIARRLHIDPDIVNKFDESFLNPVDSVLFEWRENINEQIYARVLRHALRQIASKGNGVIVGRGGNLILECADCLHVRIVAPMELRVAMYIAGEGVTTKQAREWIHRQDQRRAEFIRRLFNRDIEDTQLYDLVVNLQGLTIEMAVDLIVHAAKMRASAQLPPVPKATLPEYVDVLAHHKHPFRHKVIG